MCQLFGVNSSKRILVNQYLKEFFSHSTKHPHGWGLATFYGDAVNLEKEPLPAWQSTYLKSRLQFPFEADNLIAHIRQASQGGLAYENCHPFVLRDDSGRTWTLAHNGTLFEPNCLAQYQALQLGSTDSERILYHILHQMNYYQYQSDHPLSAEERFATIDRLIPALSDGNKLNLLLYDGEMMFVHTNRRETLHYKQDGPATLFATVPLDDDDWEALPMMQLLAFREGRLLFEGTPHSFEYTGQDIEPLSFDSAYL